MFCCSLSLHSFFAFFCKEWLKESENYKYYLKMNKCLITFWDYETSFLPARVALCRCAQDSRHLCPSSDKTLDSHWQRFCRYELTTYPAKAKLNAHQHLTFNHTRLIFLKFSENKILP